MQINKKLTISYISSRIICLQQEMLQEQEKLFELIDVISEEAGLDCPQSEQEDWLLDSEVKNALGITKGDMKFLIDQHLLLFIYVCGEFLYKRSDVDKLIGLKQMFMFKNRRHGN